MGVYDIDQVSKSEGGSGTVKITAPDKWIRIKRAAFIKPTQSTPGLTIPQQIAQLIQGALGLDQSVQITSKCTSLVGFQTWTKDREKAIVDMAVGAGLWVHFDRNGGAVIADMPTIGSAARWLIDASASGILLTLDRQKSRTATNNVVVISSSASGGALFGTQVVWDNDPTSPTYAGPDPINHPELAGPFGVSVDFFDTPLPLTNAQVRLAGLARLAKMVGVASQVTLTQTPNPNVDAFDVFDVLTPKTRWGDAQVSDRHVIDTVIHDLDPSKPLQIQGRSTRYDAYQ
jgi:hypothetical protein